MINYKGILIKNIYYMLTYVIYILRQPDFKEIAAEEFENIHDMFADILGKGVSRQLKQGLYREYIIKEDNLYTMRGRLNLKETIQNCIQQKHILTCEFDELSENNLFNQILKTTMVILIKQDSVKMKRKAVLKKLLLYFSEVDEITPSDIHWNTIHFQRNNQNYQMLLNICKLILQGLLLSTEKGNIKLASYINQQCISKLYEKFILEYYKRHHPYLHASAAQIKWDLDDNIDDFLPIMQTDITLKQNEKILIIDAKCYAGIMQSHYDIQTIRSANIYQIYTYVKNLDKENTGNVAGMLLYAKTEEQIQPDNTFSMGGNKISVKTLDLNQDFAEITNQLDTIVKNYFE